MIEIAMALVLGVAPLPDPIVRVDPELPPAYTAIEQPCTALQAGYPGMVDQFCTEGAQIFQSGLGAQIELGFFRARLTEGEFYEGGYITRQSWQFLPQVEGTEMRTARGAYSLACVNQDNGLIERNGPPQFVIVPAGQQTGSSTITLRTSGQCSLGYEREILSAWAFSDSALPWQNGSDFDTSTTGWVQGDNRLFNGDTWSGMRARVEMAPDWGEAGEIRVRVYGADFWDYSDRNAFCNSFDPMPPTTIQLNWMRTNGNNAGPITNTPPINYCNTWWPIGADGPIGSLELVGNAALDFGGIFNPERTLAPDLTRLSAWYPPGYTGDRYEPSGQIGLAATLTKFDGVRDLVWEPQERPFGLPALDGLCVDDLVDCWQACMDLVDPSLNPFDNFEMALDFLRCMIIPSTPLDEFVPLLWTDVQGTVAYQSVEYMVTNFQDVLQAPAYYARSCGTLFETDLDAVGQGAADQAFNTCDLDQDTRTLVFQISGALIVASFIFMCIRLFFWSIKQRNMLPGAQMMEDDYAAADERQNG